MIKSVPRHLNMRFLVCRIWMTLCVGSKKRLSQYTTCERFDHDLTDPAYMLAPKKRLSQYTIRERFEYDLTDPAYMLVPQKRFYEMIKSVPLRWGLGFLWALRGQCCVGGICDSKIKDIWWFTTKVCPTLRVPIGVLNSPRGITIHIYKFACLDRFVQITTNHMKFLRN